MVAEIHPELHEFVRAGNFFDVLYGADANVKRFESGDSDGGFAWRRSEVGHGSPPVVCDVGWRGNREVALFVANWCVERDVGWDDARPDGNGVIGVIIHGWASADLGRNFGER